MATLSRTVRLAPRLATVSRPAVARVGASAASQRAALSVSARRLKSGVIKETEVPVSVYSPDAKGVASGTSDHFSIPVKAARPVAAEPTAEEDEVVVPLQEKVFQQMPRTLQKMSVMGKVIVITG
jgi:hypothetical protein